MILEILALIFVLTGLKAVIEWTVSLVKWLERIGGKINTKNRGTSDKNAD